MQIERCLSQRIAFGLHRHVDGGEHVVKLGLADGLIANGDEAHFGYPCEGHRRQGGGALVCCTGDGDLDAFDGPLVAV